MAIVAHALKVARAIRAVAPFGDASAIGDLTRLMAPGNEPQIGSHIPRSLEPFRRIQGHIAMPYVAFTVCDSSGRSLLLAACTANGLITILTFL